MTSLALLGLAVGSAAGAAVAWYRCYRLAQALGVVRLSWYKDSRRADLAEAKAAALANALRANEEELQYAVDELAKTGNAAAVGQRLASLLRGASS